MARNRTEPTADVDKTADLKTRLDELGVENEVIAKIIDEFGAETIEDLSRLNEADLVLAGMKAIPARNLLASLAPTAETMPVGAMSLDVLPQGLDDSSWLQALKAGGVLKVDQSTVISTVRAALADRVGLYDVPKRLVEAMEQFAESSEEPVDPEFFKLRQQIARRSYAEIFEGIEGLDGSFVTDARRKQLLDRMATHFWPAIASFYGQLRSWQELWMQGMSNPGVMLAMIAGGNTGLGSLPTGLMQPPDTGTLRDHADSVNDALNRVFAGTGTPVAAALAFDASQVRKTLENPRLPAMIGAVNRDQMLKQLGVAVSATYPRLETNLTRFVLSTLQLESIPSGNEEAQYLSALYMLGTQISWSDLGIGSNGPTGIGGPSQL